MHITATAFLRVVTVCLLLSFTTAAPAAELVPNSAMRFVSLDLQRDNVDSQQLSGTASFTLGQHFWVQGTLGSTTYSGSDVSTSGNVGDLKQFGIGAGYSGEQMRLSLHGSRYDSDSRYQQRDIHAVLDWMAERFTLGIDLMNRSTDNSIDSVRDFPTLNLTNVTLHADEQLTGNGVGMHADIYLTDTLNLSLGGMSYSYDSDYQLTSSSNPNLIRRLLATRPTISRLVYLGNSGVTRSLALLDSSYNLGLGYQFSSAALSVNYFRDQMLDSDEVSQTITAGASVFLGDHWMLAPMIGQSRSDQYDDVTFGGLSISFNW